MIITYHLTEAIFGFHQNTFFMFYLTDSLIKLFSITIVFSVIFKLRSYADHCWVIHERNQIGSYYRPRLNVEYIQIFAVYHHTELRKYRLGVFRCAYVYCTYGHEYVYVWCVSFWHLLDRNHFFIIKIVYFVHFSYEFKRRKNIHTHKHTEKRNIVKIKHNK